MTSSLMSTLTLGNMSNMAAPDPLRHHLMRLPSASGGAAAGSSRSPLEADVDTSAKYESISAPQLDETTAYSAGQGAPLEPMLRADESHKVVRKRDFYLNPQRYDSDVRPVESVRSMNAQIEDPKSKTKRDATWRERYDMVNFPHTNGPFVLKFPGSVHAIQPVKFAKFTFSLPSNTWTMRDLHDAFKRGNGCLNLAYSADALKQAFGSIQHRDFHKGHIVPKTIKIVGENARLPIDCQIELCTHAIDSKDGMKKLVKWTRMPGTHNCGARNDAEVAHRVPMEIDRVSLQDHAVLYIADEESHNHPDCGRWSNTDPAELMRDLNKSRMKDRPDTVQVKAMGDNEIKASSKLEFLIHSEAKELREASKAANHPLPLLATNSDGETVHEVSRLALEHVIKRLFSRIDRHKMWMNVNGLVLCLKPLRSADNQGMEDLNRKAHDFMMQATPADPNWYPRYSVDIEIAYEEVDEPFDPEEAAASRALGARVSSAQHYGSHLGSAASHHHGGGKMLAGAAYPQMKG